MNSEEMKEILASNLYALIERKGWVKKDGSTNNVELARAAKVSPSYLNNILGRETSPTVDKLVTFSNVLGCEPNQLLLPGFFTPVSFDDSTTFINDLIIDS